MSKINNLIKKSPAVKKLELAKRYLQNGKEMLNKAGVDEKTRIYKDIKYVSSASGTAYLAILEALKSLFLIKGIIDEQEANSKMKDYSIYISNIKKLTMIDKDKDFIHRFFIDVYDLLHIGGYYRGELQDKKAIDSGFEKVEEVIKIAQKYVKTNSQ
jgi:hypothetical protein